MHTAVHTRFCDLDRFGRVDHVALTVMETGRVRWLDALRGTLGHVLVARSECDHLREIGADVRVVDVAVCVESVGRTSFTLAYDLRVSGEQVGRGRVVMVEVDADSPPVPVSDAERALVLGEDPGS